MSSCHLSGHEINALRWTPVQHNAVLTLVHSFWRQRMTVCSQKGIEWLMLCWLGVWMSLYICTCRLALKQAELQGPLERGHAKLHGGGTSLHQFWLPFLSEGRCISCNFRDSSLIKRHQSWQFSPMFSKNNVKEFFPKFAAFSTFLMPHIEYKTFE